MKLTSWHTLKLSTQKYHLCKWGTKGSAHNSWSRGSSYRPRWHCHGWRTGIRLGRHLGRHNPDICRGSRNSGGTPQGRQRACRNHRCTARSIRNTVMNRHRPFNLGFHILPSKVVSVSFSGLFSHQFRPSVYQFCWNFGGLLTQGEARSLPNFSLMGPRMAEMTQLSKAIHANLN